MREIRGLIEAGYKVDPFVTEYDVISLRWLARMYSTSEEARRHIRVIPGMTHDSFLFQPASFAAVVAQGDGTQI